MLGAIELDFPIRRPNDRLVGECIRLAAVRALLAAHWTCLVGTPVDVHDVGHWADYTANLGNRV